MIDLKYKRLRIIQSLDNYYPLYKYNSERERLTYTAGVLNSIWNLWNNFWREYWIAHIIGGININGSSVIPLYPNFNKKQAVFFLLIKLGKKSNNRIGDSIIGSFQEPTWGDINIIEKLAAGLLPNHANLSILLGLIGHYRIQVEHFQQIRNSFIHLNNENISKLKNIQSHYIFNSSQKLIDILEAETLSGNNKCFEDLIDNMKGLIMNL